MTAIRYIDQVPHLKGEKRKILVDAAYANDGHPIYEQWADVYDQGPVDVAALEQLLDGAVWVGEGSPWRLPDDWTHDQEFWVTGVKSFDGSSPLEINRALVFAISNELPCYPPAVVIRHELEGKRLAVLGERGDTTHADVLVAIAAGRAWKPGKAAKQ